ncbi:MAG: hypothetical protein GTO53_07460 [Planctomycetales bacterium]|nr:hypothetical protein [Planctomycetales bacterium]NIM08973.1 hypothetical protein [Planctomycetales bacterium]NIN08436.1 hypothetical protein [Planctomycetales bacterium]NIN77565.1 hypothetical protein [Planctomycetales bacterium]NIO34735.1 hypothetical protein [Planctomycetales bacterium]
MRWINPKIIGILLLLIGLWVFLAIAVPETFLKGGNLENLMRRTALYGILGIGVAFVIITAGIDLSIGSIVCLSASILALLLQVRYEPFDMQPVLAVQASQQTIVLPGHVETFAAGQKIRYQGGRRARNAMLIVTHVAPVTFTTHQNDQVAATALKVDKPLSRDDNTGFIAKLSTLTALDRGDPAAGIAPTLTLAAAHPNLAARDKLVLLDPAAGRQDLVIDAAEVRDAQTVVRLRDELGSNVSQQWLAIPVERRQRMSVLMAIAAVLLIGLILGLVHGLLITKVELQPFVVTLCGLLVYRGVARWLTNDQVQGFKTEYADSIQRLAVGKLSLGFTSHGEVIGIPYPFFILIITGVLASIFLNKTIWGRYMQAVGHNEAAARYSGIHTHWVKIVAYVICAVLACVGGMLFALSNNSVSPSAFGNFFELYAIAAAVLGGCSLRGGEGGILGVIIGTAVMQTLKNSILLLGISDTLEFVIVGLVLLGGVIADQYIKRAIDRRRLATRRVHPPA